MTPALAPAITDISQLDPNGSYTYADYLSWKFGEYVELIRGKLLRKMPAPTSVHQQISGNLYGEIYAFLKRKTCQAFHAPFDVRLLRSTANGDDQVQTMVQPDLCVICDPAKIDRRGCLGTPDWIIEIVSPGTATHDVHTKFDLYAENGVREYWIVFPGERTVAVYTLEKEAYQPGGDFYEPSLIPGHTLPELRIEWADVFENV